MNWKKNKNLKPEIILKKIDSIKSINEDGGVSYSGFEYQDSMAALYSMVNFPKQFISIQNTGLLSRAVSNVAKLGDLTKEKVLVELKSLAKQETAKREEKFSILTSVSIGAPLPIKNIKIGKSKIRFLQTDFPKKYITRKDSFKYVKRNKSDFKLEPEQYTKVIISTKAKGKHEAANQCLNDFDLFRAALSLFANSSMELIGNQWSPINKIRLGGIHTIHDKTGKNMDPAMYWFEPNFVETVPFKLNTKNISRFRKNVKWVIKKLTECKYFDLLENALLRYVRALDESDQNVALLQIWGALESITAYEENSKGNLPKRCSYLYSEHKYHKQVLENLREYRNQSVHAGAKNEEVKSYCYQLQGYFIQIIFFHLHRVEEFSTLEEANGFLDQPVEIKELKHKRDLLNKAIKFRGGN